MLLAIDGFSLNYYYIIIGLTLITFVLLSILVKENNRINKQLKKVFYITYLIVSLAAIAECLGVFFNGTSVPVWILKAVKCADYILTPIAGVALVAQLQRKSIFKKIMHITVGVNIVFQFVSVFTGWMTVVDSHGFYSHGPAYFVYIGIYMFLILLNVVEFILYGQKFSKQNKTSLYATVIFSVAGILTQEISSGEFRIAYLSLAIGMTMLFIHINEFSQLKADDTLHEQRVKNILSQIQPHFIYNSLNAIQAIDGVPEKAQNAIIDFSNFLRDNLDTLTGPDLVSFDKEIEHVKKYISLEYLRFGNKVKVNFDIKCSNFMLPVLTLQMLVENAIKHGITKKYEGGTVEITTEQFEDNYVIVVKDDGVGFDTQKIVSNSHIGLRNIKKRLEYLVNGTLNIESKIGSGTTATITIPKTNKTVITTKINTGSMGEGENK